MTETLTQLTRLIALVFLLSSMSGIGLGLTVREISAPLRDVPFVARALRAILILGIHFPSVLRLFGTGAIGAVVLFRGLSRLAGWRLGGRNPAQKTVLCLGTGLRNIPAALVVSVQNFKDPNVPNGDRPRLRTRRAVP